MKKIFVSYCHKDEKWKDRLLRHLKLLRNVTDIEPWEDRLIKLGDEWRLQIEAAMQEADAAILLVSTDFLISDFICKYEIPILLERKQNDGLTLIPVLVEPCSWTIVPWLSNLQLFHEKGNALSKLPQAECEEKLAQLTNLISQILHNQKSGTNSSITLTSTTKLSNFILLLSEEDSQSLNSLNAEGCLKLFYRYYDLERNDNFVGKLVERCGFHAQSVEWLAQTGKNSWMGLEELSKLLEQEMGVVLRSIGNTNKNFTISELKKLTSLKNSLKQKGIYLDENRNELIAFENKEVEYKNIKFRAIDSSKSTCADLNSPEYGKLFVHLDILYNAENVGLLFVDKIIKLNPAKRQFRENFPFNDFVYPHFPFKRCVSFLSELEVRWIEKSKDEVYCKVCFPGGMMFEKEYRSTDILTHPTHLTPEIDPSSEEFNEQNIYRTFVDDTFFYIWPDFIAEDWDFYYFYICEDYIIPSHSNVKIINGKNFEIKADITFDKPSINRAQHIRVSKKDLVIITIDNIETGFFSISRWLHTYGHSITEQKILDSLSIDLGTSSTCSYIYSTSSEGLPKLSTLVIPNIKWLGINGKGGRQYHYIPVTNNALIPTLIGKRIIGERNITMETDGFFESFNLITIPQDFGRYMDVSDSMDLKVDVDADIKRELWGNNGYNLKEVFIRLYLLLIFAKIRALGFQEIKKIKLSIPHSVLSELRNNYKKYVKEALSKLEETGIKVKDPGDSIRFISESDALIKGKGLKETSMPPRGTFLIMDMGGGILYISCTTTLREEPLFIDSIGLGGDKIMKALETIDIDFKDKYFALHKLENEFEKVKERFKERCHSFQYKFLNAIKVFVDKCLEAFEVNAVIKRLCKERITVKNPDGNLSDYKLKYYLFGRGWRLFDENILNYLFPEITKINVTDMKTALVESMSTMSIDHKPDTQTKSILGITLLNESKDLLLSDWLQIPYLDRNDIKSFNGFIFPLKDRQGYFHQLIPPSHLDILELSSFDLGKLRQIKKDGIITEKQFVEAEAYLNFLLTMTNVSGFTGGGIDKYCIINGTIVRSPVTWLILQDSMWENYFFNQLIAIPPGALKKTFANDENDKDEKSYRYNGSEFCNIFQAAKTNGDIYESPDEPIMIIDFHPYLQVKYDGKDKKYCYFVLPKRGRALSNFFLQAEQDHNYYNLPDKSNRDTEYVTDIDIVSCVFLKNDTKYQSLSDLEHSNIDVLEYLKENIETVMKGTVVYLNEDV